MSMPAKVALLSSSHLTAGNGNFWINNYANWSQVIGQRIMLFFPDDDCPPNRRAECRTMGTWTQWP